MSGIVGVLRRDGSQADPATVADMLGTIEHRGPDGCDVVTNGPVGLGQARLATTPARHRSTLPRRDGTVLLTADARLDNRSELCDALDLENPDRRSDSEIIVESYREWGRECVEHFIGVFAIALYDTARERLFLARDHFGVKPLYYYHSPRVVAFGTEEKSVLAQEDCPEGLNHRRIGEYLVDIHPSYERTYYRGITRLPPGHRLTVTRDASEKERYWELDTDRSISLSSDEAYATKFRELFRTAVECRLRGRETPGAFLSGGHDSSAIACVARDILEESGDLPLSTYSGHLHPEGSDESEYRKAVLDQGGFDPTVIDGDRHDPLEELQARTRVTDSPFFPDAQLVFWRLLGEAENETRVLLSGAGGDEITAHGWEFLPIRAKNARLWPLWQDVRALADRTGLSRREILVDEVLKQLAPNPIRRAKHWIERPEYVRNRSPVVDQEFAERVGLDETLRRDVTTRPILSHRGLHAEMFLSPWSVAAMEQLDKLAAARGIELRYPFRDRRLVRYALGLPLSQKFRRGEDRVVMRNALAGVVPSVVQTRTTKADFTVPFTEALARYGSSTLHRWIFEDREWSARFLDFDHVTRTYEVFLDNRDYEEARHLGRAAVLAAWCSES